MNSPAEVSMRGGEFDGEFLTSLRQEVDAWSAHDALAQLVAMFGGVFPRHANLAARLAALDEFSEVWDYRAVRGRVGADSRCGAKTPTAGRGG